MYNGGLSVRSSLNTEIQIIADNALKKGLLQYDKRHGWRGSLLNIKSKDWVEKTKDLKIDNSLNWKLAKVVEINLLSAKIQTEDKEIGFIDFKNISWTRKKNFKELFNLNDIIYVKKIKKNKWSLKQLPKINGAIVVMDPYTGRVLAMAGGFSFKLSEFNRATQAKRQPGSAFKPIVYATALENGFSPSTLVLDAPFVMEQGEGLKTWKPENYGKKFYGPSTLRTGIEKSRNLMTVRVAQEVGFEEISKIRKILEDKHTKADIKIDWKEADAFMWQSEGGCFRPVKNVNSIPLELLKGIDQNIDILLENTIKFSKSLKIHIVLK